ncbi:hypothetical protein [endosymbiont 'TC1' of Trimyema compressum]|uniref:hypothetical protein n=1 Tax=endosymbiont 'TC1' of Trimyema compressum TaxID=243899 RepID=UPI0013922BD2|nr:hypothetical protein [endosymbiont 'TC1' of Trimyema compressum]
MGTIPSARTYAESITKHETISITEDILDKDDIIIESTLPNNTEKAYEPSDNTTKSQENSLSAEESKDLQSAAFATNQEESTYLIKDINFRKVINRHLGKSGSLLETYSATKAE